MSLSFTASGSERVSIGSGATLDDITTGTCLAWVNPTSVVEGRIYQKAYAGGDGTVWVFYLLGGGGSNFGFEYTRATTGLVIYSAGALVTSGEWQFLAAAFDGAGANGDQKLYRGTLTALATETTYTSQQVGSGAIVSNAASTGYIGNRGNFNIAFPGQIGWYAMWNRKLSEGEIQQQQYHPRPTSGCVGFWHLGLHGASTVPDLSGNGNTGTVTSATVSAHVPIGPLFAFDDDDAYVVAAAPGGDAVPQVWSQYRRRRAA